MQDTLAYPSFEHLSTDHINSLNIDLQTFKHKVTGAMHYHFASNSNENVFLVGFRTVPQDSSGVAHILEHTALCGSDKYPVRDPFFMMLRRSLNTFMNALTSSDWTAYPFASCNKKDFDNLLSVYLDAAFFSRLDPLDFAQEGHRIELEDNTNLDSDLVYKGVVFNEMKGAMSSVTSLLWYKLTEHLFSDTTYHHNSGGDPKDIPSLSYEALQAFYQTHYHPSNAALMTFGDIPANDLQQRFEERALKQFSASNTTISIPFEPRISSPKTIVAAYASTDDDAKSHVITGWLLGETNNLQRYLEAQLLQGLLMDNSASPLRQALETSAYGSSPSPLCGLDDSGKEMIFIAGLEGCDQTNDEAIEQEILQVLQDIATNGAAQADIDAVLHQLELHQREIGGDGYPYGLQLIMQTLPSVIHRGDPVAMLNIETALETLRKNAESPDYVKQLVQTILLNNPHRVRLCMYPDATLEEQDKQAEADTLADIKSTLTDAQKTAIVTQADALLERQQQKDDPDILPKVGLEDIPAEIATYTATIIDSPIKQTRYTAGTNGLVYQQALLPLAALNAEQLSLLPLYCCCLTEVGFTDASYLQVQQRQAAQVGSISGSYGIRNNRTKPSEQIGYLTISAKALGRNYHTQTQLLVDTLQKVQFNELSRLKELLSQYTAQKLQGVVQSGHSYAMQAASANYGVVNQFEYQTTGLKGIQRLKHLSQSFDDESNIKDLSIKLNAMHAILIAQELQVLEIGEHELFAAQNSISTWPHSTQAFSGSLQLPENTQPNSSIWQCNSAVNYCAMAFPTVAPTHADAAPLTVLGGFMRNGILHNAIREQGGAYGGGATHDAASGAFKFYSYRDPRLEDTFSDFKRAIDWVVDTSHDDQALEEAILGVIGSLDKPGSPAGEATNDYFHKLYGRSYEQRMAFRHNVINTQISDLQRVANQYLSQPPSYALVSGESEINAAKDFLDTLDATFEVL